MPDRSETVRLLNRSARVRFYVGQSSCLGCRAELAADRIFIKAAINRGAENGFERRRRSKRLWALHAFRTCFEWASVGNPVRETPQVAAVRKAS